GNSFDRSIDQFGLVASAVRLGDKYNRFSQLINANQQVKDESIRDTLIDLANYAVMTILWLDEKGEVVNEESYRL
ncbi:nucleotide modification associated domain-containing protein, partial [Escherichia coli]|nr:nucleotide modification associated domain-containing protein [Escherichia coli]